MVKRQHRIPVMLLKRFTENGERKGELYIYDVEKGKYYTSSPEKFGCESFATEITRSSIGYNGIFETYASKLESEWNDLFDYIESKKVTNSGGVRLLYEDVWSLVAFCYYQFIRSFEADKLYSKKFENYGYARLDGKLNGLVYTERDSIINNGFEEVTVEIHDYNKNNEVVKKELDSYNFLITNLHDIGFMTVKQNFEIEDITIINFRNPHPIASNIVYFERNTLYFSLNKKCSIRIRLRQNKNCISRELSFGFIDFLENDIGIISLKPKFYVKCCEFTEDEKHFLSNIPEII